MQSESLTLASKHTMRFPLEEASLKCVLMAGTYARWGRF